MKKILFIALAASGLSASTVAAQTTFKATITHDQEVSNPPVPAQGSSGFGTFILNAAQTALSYDVTLSGLDLDGLQTPVNPNDNVTRVHFHRAPTGANGGIVYGIIDGNAALQNDNNPNDLVVTPLTGRMTGIWNLAEGNGTTLGAELANLLAGNLYFNVHTADHAGGEVRGQVLLVPEPGNAGLALLGAVALIRRRIHNK